MNKPGRKKGIVDWIDHRLPIFTFLRHELDEYPTPRNLNYLLNFGSLAGGELPNVLGPLAIGCTLIFGIRAVLGRPLTEIQTSVVLSALSLALSIVIKN
jgi:hypothetical protein